MTSSGYSLVEALVATAILLLLTASAARLFDPLQGTVQAQPEAEDQHQRLRVAAAALTAALRAAGSGSLVGPSRGLLAGSLPAVLPYRIGEVRSDLGAGIRYRPDVVSMVSVPLTAAQTPVASAVPVGGAMLELRLAPTCPAPTVTSVCGFAAGVRVIVFDSSGAWDLATVTGVDVGLPGIALSSGVAHAYGPEAVVSEVEVRSFSLGASSEGVPQLLQYDGFRGEFPVVDNVVLLALEYFGDPAPPALLSHRPLDSLIGPWTTYGPRPPLPAVDDERDAWPTGENCVFRLHEGQHVPRLSTLAALSDLVVLPPEMLTDGPWCPDASHTDAFDADLLRVRRVRVRLRTQVGSAALRGRGTAFMFPGQSTSAERRVPDQEVEFDVSPSTMAVWR